MGLILDIVIFILVLGIVGLFFFIIPWVFVLGLFVLAGLFIFFLALFGVLLPLLGPVIVLALLIMLAFMWGARSARKRSRKEE